MSLVQCRTFTQAANTWTQTIGTVVQIIAILVGGWWAYKTFVFEKLATPKANINTTLSVQLTRVDYSHAASDGKRLLPIELRATATNPSTRTIYLLPTLWLAYGYELKKDAVVAGQSSTFQLITDKANQRVGQFALRYADVDEPVPVAGGNLFADTSLRPGETVTRTLILFVPRPEFDVLEVQSFVPTVAQPSGIEFKWHLRDNRIIEPTLFRLHDGQSTPLKIDETLRGLDEKLGFQIASVGSQVSLWEKSAPSDVPATAR